MEEPEFLYDPSVEERRDDLNKIIELVSKEPKPYEARAIFLKKFTEAMFDTFKEKKYKKSEIEKKVPEKEIKVEEIKPQPQIIINIEPRKFEKIELPSIPSPPSLGVPRPSYAESFKELNVPTPKAPEFRVLQQEKIQIQPEPAKLFMESIEEETIEEPIETAKGSGVKSTEDKVNYEVAESESNLLGYGKIDPLIKDTQIKGIYCNGLNKPVIVDHMENGKIETNLIFKSSEELNDLIIMIAKRLGKTISKENPVLDASLPEGGRIQATLGNEFVDSKLAVIKY